MKWQKYMMNGRVLIMNNAFEGPEERAWEMFLHKAKEEVGNNDDHKEDKQPEEKSSAKSSPITSESMNIEAKKKLYNWEELEWVQLCDKLIAISDGSFPVKDTDEMEEWIYLVSRFSFSLASMATLGKISQE